MESLQKPLTQLLCPEEQGELKEIKLAGLSIKEPLHWFLNVRVDLLL